jgi:F1F0 ATPase subunit 2
MNETESLLLALLVGALLGAAFFGGLWWTIVRGLSSRRAAVWFIGSLLLRTAITLAGFYLVARDDWGAAAWERLLACLVGFLAARLMVRRLVGAAGRSSSAERSSHAS